MITLPLKKRLYPLLLFLLASLVIAHKSYASPNNDFDVSNSTINVQEIHRGGPPRDGIPSIDNPKFDSPHLSGYMSNNRRVLGLTHNGESKAYPISIMNWHEIVNDTIGGMPVVVTFCPLCGTGVAFSAHAGGKRLNFGVSGLLYNSDVLLYDRETESLWSQLLFKSISGPMKGTKLKLLPLEHTTWGDWRKRHPDTKILSENTGYRRDYYRDPYAGYENSEGIYFPVSNKDPRYHPKERVLGIEINGESKAYPFAELSKTNGTVSDNINGTPVTIHYSAKSHSAHIQGADGKNLPGITAFWFSWIAFHPDTLVFIAP